jgi:hypothetical protein
MESSKIKTASHKDTTIVELPPWTVSMLTDSVVLAAAEVVDCRAVDDEDVEEVDVCGLAVVVCWVDEVEEVEEVEVAGAVVTRVAQGSFVRPK